MDVDLRCSDSWLAGPMQKPSQKGYRQQHANDCKNISSVVHLFYLLCITATKNSQMLECNLTEHMVQFLYEVANYALLFGTAYQ